MTDIARILRAHIDHAASRAQRGPSDGQKEAGNYRKGKIRFHGLEISIENPRGSTRSGADKGGKRWSVRLPDHYGYIKRTEGSDKTGGLPKYADGGAVGDDYNTVLNPAEEQAFQIWKSQNAPNDSGADYDLRGAYLANMQRAENGHMGDQFKKPNHPTFSDQSQYATGDQRDRAGFWVGPEGPDQTFVPPVATRAAGGRTGYAEGGTPATKPPFDPSQPFQPQTSGSDKPAFDPTQPFQSAPETEATPGIGAQTWDALKQGAKGLARGAEGFVGDLGEAVMGPFGPSHHAANLMADIGLGERPATDPTYGQQLAHATGVEANPQTTAGKYAGAIGEVAGNPASYIGPGGPIAKTIAAGATGAGGEAARELTEGMPFEGPAALAGSLLGGYAAGKAAAVPQNIARSRAAQTTEQLHQAATNAYDSARALGVEYQPQKVAQLQASIESDLLHQGHRDDLASGTFRRIDELTNLPQRTAGLPNFSDLEGIRKSLNKVRSEVNPKTGGPSEDAKAATTAINHIDDFLADPRNAIPAHQGQSLQNTGIAIAGNPNSPAAQAARFAQEGRGNWSAMVSAQQIENAAARGELNAGASGSGANIDNALRQQIKSILANPRRAKGFSADEQQMMRDIVLGNPVRNSARLIGKMAATGIVSAAGIEYLTHTLGLGPVGHAMVPAAGYAAKKAGDYMTRARINRLLEAIRMDSPAGRANPIGPRASTLPFTARALLTSPYGNMGQNPYQP